MDTTTSVPSPPATGRPPVAWRLLGGLMLVASVGLTSCQALLHGF
jgi:hypothetical protein